MTAREGSASRSAFARRVVAHAPPLLDLFNQCGVLDPVDIHAAVTVGRLLGEATPDVLLAAALAVRGTRFGHVRIGLPDVRRTVVVENVAPEKVASLPWPEPEPWRANIAASPLCGAGELGRPLVLRGDCLYLQRYWAYEQAVAESLSRRASLAPLQADGYHQLLATVLPDPPDRIGQPNLQRHAAAMAATQRLTVMAGGPGTGKTYTVARLLAAFLAASDLAPADTALAAPTGKAAERLTGQVRRAADELPLPSAVKDRLRLIEAKTIHGLLGYHPARGRFRHGPDDPLPQDLIVVDEMSMVSLPLAAKLLAAAKPESRLVLVGDPNQLVSIEAGSVLRDLVGAASDKLHLSASARQRLEPLAGALPPDIEDHGGFGDCVVVLDHGYRAEKGSGILELADAVRLNVPAEAIKVLEFGWKGLDWMRSDEQSPEAIPQLTQALTKHAQEVAQLGQEGKAVEALDTLEESAVLCAHRRGPSGVYTWVETIERLADLRGPRRAEWYPGRPVMVTANDYTLSLFNGDIGVTVVLDGRLLVAFRGPDRQQPRLFGPARLANIETVHAMTIHKSQGSDFDRVVILLPDKKSPLLTRQLLYTAITRARKHVTLVGTEESIKEGILRGVARASGLEDLVWGPKGRSIRQT